MISWKLIKRIGTLGHIVSTVHRVASSCDYCALNNPSLGELRRMLRCRVHLNSMAVLFDTDMSVPFL